MIWGTSYCFAKTCTKAERSFVPQDDKEKKVTLKTIKKLLTLSPLSPFNNYKYETVVAVLLITVDCKLITVI